MNAKSDDYFRSDRSDFLNWVSGSYGRVLDIGCGAGANAAWYRRHGAQRITGIEIDAEAAAIAATMLDEVHRLPVEAALPKIRDDRYDLIVCADVLEHLVDPWTVVADLRQVASPGARLAISMPNLRFLPAIARIAIGRGVAYEESGIFDATHLRFFVRSDLEKMLLDAGWRPVRWGAPTPGQLRRLRLVLRQLTRGQADQWMSGQIFVLAELAAQGE